MVEAFEQIPVYATGWGISGQLGQGAPQASAGGRDLNRTRPSEISAFQGRAVEQIVCGSRASYALTTNGQVYCWGKGEDGQLGHGATNNEFSPRLVEMLGQLRIVQIACRGSHAVALDDGGRVWSWGACSEGQLGVGDTTCGDDFSKPTLVLDGLKGEQVAHVGCGREFTVCATRGADSKVFTWGQGEDGQLGLGKDVRSVNTPALVFSPDAGAVVQIACGSRHVLLRTEQDAVYVWGWGTSGQLGLGGSETVAQPCLHQDTFTFVACGFRHSIALDSKRALHTWGCAAHRQLGHGSSETDELRPRAVLPPEGYKAPQDSDPRSFVCSTAAAGGAHTVAVDHWGICWAFGRNDDGQLGIGHANPVLGLVRMPLPERRKARQIACGWAHTVVQAAPSVPTEMLSPWISPTSRGSLLPSLWTQSFVGGSVGQKYVLWAKGDVDAFFSQFMNVLLQVMVIRQLGAAVLGGDAKAEEIVLEGMLPGYAAMLLVSHGALAAQAYRRMKSEKAEYTAQPHGINSMLLFAYLNLILQHAYQKSGDPVVAYGAALVCCLASGVFQLMLVPFALLVRQTIPKPALLSALAGTSITFLTLQFVFQIFERPLTGLIPFIFIVLSFSAEVRLPFGIPGGFFAILAGAALNGFTRIFPGLQEPSAPVHVDPVGLVQPQLQLEALSRGWEAGIAALPLALPLSILNFVGNLATVESAAAGGDRYSVEETLVVDSLATIAGALVGCPFPGAVFIGHPAYKKMGARCGYLALNFSATAVIAAFRLTSYLLLVVPLDSVVTILLWVGVVISAQSFQSTEDSAAAAVIFGMLPGIAAWTCTEIAQVVSGTGTTLEAVTREQPTLYLNGLFSLRMGYALVSLVLASLYHFVEERKFKSAAAWAFVGALLSATGMIHTFTLEGNNLSPLVGFLPDERSKCFVIAYSIIGAMLLMVALRDDETTLRGWLRMLRRGIRQGSFKPLDAPARFATPVAGPGGMSPSRSKDLSEPLLRR